MLIDAVLQDAIKTGFTATITEDVREIVAKETRRALREHEEEITQLIRAAVNKALEEALK
jgi:hypothetical protein